MPSADGFGLARKAWDAYVLRSSKVFTPPLEAIAGKQIRTLAGTAVMDLVGFWVLWHMYGGFEGLEKELGLSKATIWRRVAAFRKAFGAHPDEFEFPGITIDLTRIPTH